MIGLRLRGQCGHRRSRGFPVLAIQPSPWCFDVWLCREDQVTLARFSSWLFGGLKRGVRGDGAPYRSGHGEKGAFFPVAEPLLS